MPFQFLNKNEWNCDEKNVIEKNIIEKNINGKGKDIIEKNERNDLLYISSISCVLEHLHLVMFLSLILQCPYVATVIRVLACYCCVLPCFACVLVPCIPSFLFVVFILILRILSIPLKTLHAHFNRR